MSEPIRLLQFSDTHLFGDRSARIKGVCSYDTLRAVLAAARVQHWNAAALLLTGDLVHDDPAAYGHVREIFGALGKPVLCLPGNHDELPALHQALGAAPFQIGGHADIGLWRIVMLDSVVPGAVHGELSAAELQRLEVALVGAGNRQVLLCLHHHPVELASSWLDQVMLKNGRDFFAIVDRFPHVRAICWGHVHQQFDVRRRGVRLMAVPSTCAQFKPSSESFELDSSAPGYRRFVLHADGRIESEVIRVDVVNTSAATQVTASG
jgi:Icc protein